MTHSIEDVLKAYPDRQVDRDNYSLYAGWLAHELRFPKCLDCGRWHQPSRSICPFCWSTNLVPTPVSGKGKIHIAITLYQGQAWPGVRYPYPVTTIEFDEQPGLRYTSTVVGSDLADIRIGLPVELEWIERNGVPFPAFRIVEAAAGGRS